MAEHLSSLLEAQSLAQSGRFREMLAVSQRAIDMCGNDVGILMEFGVLLLSQGFLTLARECFLRASAIAPNDLRAAMNLANVAGQVGDHAESRQLYASLVQRLPNNSVIRRNALVSLEYDPMISDAERLEQACAWGRWAMSRAGCSSVRSVLKSLNGRPMRVGYVSADICQHTVGLFVRGVIQSHDPVRMEVFVYSAGQAKDWVTDAIRSSCKFRDVAALGDEALAALIRQDGIDVLVDLSGHTAGSRLTVFAHRPAPVQVSWLGYFATTGLPVMDAVLLDDWHAPHGMEKQFTEPIVRLPGGRFLYVPVPYAPTQVAALPCLAKGYVTFGCFNNSTKFNGGVFNLWAKILASVPDSRLVLKWRTFQDELLCGRVRGEFSRRGIDPLRIELRGASFHVDMLGEYADIDIALDPFPFTGGLTSCEALWMGVPVVTWPQSRLVSRQTYAFLSAIGLPELAAHDPDDYVRIAVELAGDRQRLAELRSTMRERMRGAPLMDVGGFTRQLEKCYFDLYADVAERGKASIMNQKKLLNVGAGHPNSGASIPAAFRADDWREVRLDIDPVNEPDILGSMLDMSAVGDESIDAIYSSHNIEHLYPDEIPLAMREFLRVLKPEGYAVITCPDLQAAAQMIADDRLLDAAYQSPAGVVTPFDIVYSHRQFTGRDKPFMAHHCGFTLKVLMGTLKENGFPSVAGKKRPPAFDLWVVAGKRQMSDEELHDLAEKVLPR